MSRRSAIMRATTSAWSTEFHCATTRFTPTATTRPDFRSNTAAPNGPPVCRSTFSRERRIARRMRSTPIAKGLFLAANFGYRFYGRRLDRFYTCDWQLLQPESTTARTGQQAA